MSIQYLLQILHIVDQPVAIEKMTYREMRELAYAGFSVFHDEALMPAFLRSVPVCIKNTNNPECPGNTNRKRP